MLTTPILSQKNPFNATAAQDFYFDVIGGDRVYKALLEIAIVSNGEDNGDLIAGLVPQNIVNGVYKFTISANLLTNGKFYKARIKTYNQIDVASSFSNYISFSCFAPAIVTVTGVTEGGEITEQSHLFEGTYVGDDPIKTFQFILYSSDNIELADSGIYYYTQTQPIEHSFTFENDTDYKIKLICISQNEVEGYDIKSFHVSYIAPDIGMVLVADFNEDTGMVNVSTVARLINGDGEGYSYFDGTWVVLTAPDSYVTFVDNVNKITTFNYSIKMFLTGIQQGASQRDYTYLIVYTQNGRFELQYYEEAFHIYMHASNSGLVANFEYPFVVSSDIYTVAVEIKMLNGYPTLEAQIVV